MSWHWSAASVLGFALASCGGAGRAVPAEVEIDWPDAARRLNPELARVHAKVDAGAIELSPVTDALPPTPE